MLQTTLNNIGKLDAAAMAAAQNHQHQLAIPPGSLGRLHELAVRLAGITGTPRPAITNTAIITMAGDHGIAAQGVSKFPQEVTREMVNNFARGGAAINVLARHASARLTVVDMGVAGPEFDITSQQNNGVRFKSLKIAGGTKDFSTAPAMTRDQALQALENGISVFLEERAQGLDAVGTGDMGIANTTPSAAIAAVMLNTPPDQVVNRGTGIGDDALPHKIEVVKKAIRHNRPDPSDPVDVLAKVGGFEIGGIAGVILGACAHRVPVVIDGFISTAGALIASAFHPEVKNYLFAGHQSAVDGHSAMLSALDLFPLVNLMMRLGEGTGAALGLFMLKAASRISTDMLTFEEASVSGPT